MTPALVIHGGAWAIPDREVDDHLDAMRRAAAAGRTALERGAAALDAVVAVIELLEDHPALDAAIGAVLNRAGGIQLDAGVMDGASGDFGAVCAASRIRHPIAAAARILRTSNRQFSLLAGPGADAWAAAQGLETVDPQAFIVPRELARYERLVERERWHTSIAFKGEKGPSGTVGCVAVDRDGRVAAGTSTGGAPFTVPGRVGDSPLPGSGYWASATAGASATGWGEAIARVLMCAFAVERIEAGDDPQRAADVAVARLGTRVLDPDGHGATGGIILADRTGRLGLAFSSPRMARASWRSGGEIEVAC